MQRTIKFRPSIFYKNKIMYRKCGTDIKVNGGAYNKQRPEIRDNFLCRWGVMF